MMYRSPSARGIQRKRSRFAAICVARIAGLTFMEATVSAVSVLVTGIPWCAWKAPTASDNCFVKTVGEPAVVVAAVAGAALVVVAGRGAALSPAAGVALLWVAAGAGAVPSAER